MKTLEIRRHSNRSPLGDHLNQTGITLARLVGQNIGPFDRVITSTLPRAFDTAVAMGFAVDEQNDLISSYTAAVEREVPWPQEFETYAEFVKREGAAAKFAHKLAKYYREIMNHLGEGHSALVISHGGIVELSVVGCLLEEDFSTWGGPVSYCEGARLYWDGKFIRAEVLRVNK